MRKAISKLSCALSAFMLMCLFMLSYTANGANTAKAADAIFGGGWTAIVENGTGYLLSCDIDEETIIVPSTIKGTNRITSIDHFCITDKVKMKTLIISEGITDVESFGIVDNSALTSVYFPKSLTIIDGFLFIGCDNLKYIYYGGTEQEWKNLMSDQVLISDELENAVIKYECGSSVSGFKATSANNSITLSWNKNPSANGYVIEQLSGGQWKQLKTITSNSTASYTVSGLKNATEYSFRISSFWDINENHIESEPVTIKAVTKTPSVTGFKVKSKNAKAVRLTWSKSSTADGYVIQRKNGSSWVNVKTISTPSTTEYLVENLDPNVSYTFRIRAYNKVNGTTQYSSDATVSATTDKLTLSGFKVKSRSSDAIRFSWNKNSSPTGYIIERKSGSKWITAATISSPSTTEYVFRGLSPNTYYTYRIKAYMKVNGKTYYSAAASVSTYTNPTAVSGFKLKTRGTNSLKLSWNKNTLADGYIIERKNGSSWVRIKKLTTNKTTEYLITGLNPGTSYTYRIKTYKMHGSAGYTGNSKTITATTSPADVSGFAVSSKAGDTVNLKWNKQSSASGYIIEQKSGSTWKRIAKLTSNSTLKYSVYKLKANTSYSFRIKSYKMVGSVGLHSGYKTLTVKTSASGVSNPNTVTGLKLKGRATTALRLAWDKNPNAAGYIIEQKSGSSWKQIAKITSASTCEYRISSLKAGTAYSFRIKAYKTSGKKSYFSSYVSISATTNPSAVTGLKAVSNTETTIKFSWNKNTSAQGYIIEYQSGSNWKQLGKITKNSTTSCTVTGLKPNTKLNLRIKAYLTSGSTTLYSSYVTITAPTKTDPTAVNGFSGYTSFDTPTIPEDEWGAGNTKYKGNNDDYFLSAKYDGTKAAKVTVSVIYNNLSHSYTHVIGIYLNERDHIDFALPSGMVNDGSVLNAGIIDGNWGIRALGADRFTSKDVDNINVCSLTALHVDWTGVTPSIFYFQFSNDQKSDELYKHQYEGVIAVELGFNINHPPTPKCIRCNGTGRCIGCNGIGRFLNQVCTWCHGNGRCDKCQGTGTVVKATDTGVCDNVYLP